MQVDTKPGLREALGSSKLSERDPAELKAYDMIVDAIGDALQPGERVLAYADRDLEANEVDALAYDAEPKDELPDVMGYQAGGPANETDAFLYDKGAGRGQPDVMGYQPGGPRNETDAFAYDRPPDTPDNDAFAHDRPPETPENDAFMPPSPPPPADVDFLVLTDTRLLRGFLEHGKMMIAESPYEHPQIRVIADDYLAVRLPEALCGLSEGSWWCWRVPEGTEPKQAAKRWSRN